MTEDDTFDRLKYQIKIDSNGNQFYWNSNNQLHREDGPAEIHVDGTKAWWLNGKMHREDGPAIEWADGSKSWYIDGKFHRVAAPQLKIPMELNCSISTDSI